MTNHDSPRAIRIFLAVVALIVLAMFFYHRSAAAHDHDRPALNGWFKTLRNKNTVPCCDGSDAMRLDDVDWDAKDGHYRVRLEGEWVDVPDNAVIEQPNQAGPTMVWPYRQDGKLNQVRCFMPGSMT